MNKILKVALAIGLFGTLQANAKLQCKVAPLSLYSVEHKNVKRIKSNRTYTIETVINADGTTDRDKLLVNKEVYDLYSRDKGEPTSYIRGQYLILEYKDKYYIRKVGTTHTARLNCK